MSRATFQCPHCHQKFAARAGVVGKTVRCLACGATFLAGAVQLPPPPPPPPDPERQHRRLAAWGLAGLLAGGVLACYWGIWGTLQEMLQRKPEVKYSTAGLMAGPMLLMLGLGLAVILLVHSRFPAAAERLSDDLSWWQKLLLLALFGGPLTATGYWFEKKAEALGYQYGSLRVPVPPPVPGPSMPPPRWRPGGVGAVEEMLKDIEKKERAKRGGEIPPDRERARN